MLKLAYDKLKLLKHLQSCNTTDLQNNFKNQWSSPNRVKKASGFEYCHGSWCCSWLWRLAIVTGFSLWAFKEVTTHWMDILSNSCTHLIHNLLFPQQHTSALCLSNLLLESQSSNKLMIFLDSTWKSQLGNHRTQLETRFSIFEDQESILESVFFFGLASDYLLTIKWYCIKEIKLTS